MAKVWISESKNEEICIQSRLRKIKFVSTAAMQYKPGMSCQLRNKFCWIIPRECKKTANYPWSCISCERLKCFDLWHKKNLQNVQNVKSYTTIKKKSFIDALKLWQMLIDSKLSKIACLFFQSSFTTFLPLVCLQTCFPSSSSQI